MLPAAYASSALTKFNGFSVAQPAKINSKTTQTAFKYDICIFQLKTNAWGFVNEATTILLFDFGPSRHCGRGRPAAGQPLRGCHACPVPLTLCFFEIIIIYLVLLGKIDSSRLPAEVRIKKAECFRFRWFQWGLLWQKRKKSRI